jgi:hypothetical protein
MQTIIEHESDFGNSVLTAYLSNQAPLKLSLSPLFCHFYKFIAS